MIQPNELKFNLPVEIPNAVVTTTSKVWEILIASHDGNLEKVKALQTECPSLIYAQYNYVPPIHFAVREGHVDLVKYLLDNGAHDPEYKIYPFLDNLQTIALDREFNNIALLLEQYANNPAMHKHKGDNGKIHFNRTEQHQEFEDAVHTGNLDKTETILKIHPEFALDETFFWGEGILMKPAQHEQRKLLELLMSYGAKVPDILKWTQFYYFKFYDTAAFLIKNGMNANVMSWHHVTILHDMAQKGDIPKAELLIKHGAEVNSVEEEYQSTPLGMAVRWGHSEMVEYLLKQGADPNKSGTAWAKPLAWARKKGHTNIESILRKAGAQ